MRLSGLSVHLQRLNPQNFKCLAVNGLGYNRLGFRCAHPTLSVPWGIGAPYVCGLAALTGFKDNA